MAMSPHAALRGLARAYLDLVAATDAAHGDPDDRPHAASQRAVIHDQILQALGLTRADPFNPIAWAKAVVASAARRDARIDEFYASVPFEFNQPLERYRLHHGMRLAAFAAFLGITEDEYLRLVAGDRHLSPAATRRIADALGTLPWLINEIAPRPSPEEPDRLDAAIREHEAHGDYHVDRITGEMIGPIRRAPGPAQLPHDPAPLDHMLLADALAKLHMVHPSRDDQDYPRVRGYLEQRIRTALGLPADAPFDLEAWADRCFYPRLEQAPEL
jgi:transcriptional regulator with XRE-family HTH domain